MRDCLNGDETSSVRQTALFGRSPSIAVLQYVLVPDAKYCWN